MTMHFEINSRTVDDRTAVVAPVGEVDLHTAPEIKRRIAELSDQGYTQIVVDLSRINYLDSTGLGVLVGALKRLREKDGELRLVHPTPRVMRVLEITRLVNVFQIFDSEEAALSSLTGRGA
jgi:anti-sigma B factor antagonist